MAQILVDKNKLKKKESQKFSLKKEDKKLNRAGLEPATYCLEGSCSIQLSYRSIINLQHQTALF
jgi:hypothetical protein